MQFKSLNHPLGQSALNLTFFVKLFSRRFISSRFLHSILDPDKTVLLTALVSTKCFKILVSSIPNSVCLEDIIELLFFNNSPFLSIRTL